LLAAVVVDDFDVVAVWVKDVGGVVALVILRALAGLPVAAIPGCGRVGVKPSSSSPEKAMCGSITWPRPSIQGDPGPMDPRRAD
jgi:hypothetical protein